jgi:hypothetical protein
MKGNRGDREFLPYRAYLIRLWPTKRDGINDYRVSVQNVATGDRHEFLDLKQFIYFIQDAGGQAVSIHVNDHDPKPLS